MKALEQTSLDIVCHLSFSNTVHSENLPGSTNPVCATYTWCSEARCEFLPHALLTSLDDAVAILQLPAQHDLPKRPKETSCSSKYFDSFRSISGEFQFRLELRIHKSGLDKRVAPQPPMQPRHHESPRSCPPTLSTLKEFLFDRQRNGFSIQNSLYGVHGRRMSPVALVE